MDVIDTLMELIAIDSSNPFTSQRIKKRDGDRWILGGNERRIAKVVEQKLVAAGFTCRRQPVHRGLDGRRYHNIVAEKGDGDRSLLCYGHLDTVTTRPWSSPAAALRPRMAQIPSDQGGIDGVVGLGAADMKAGLAVMLSAFADVKPRGFRLKLAFGVDEEFYSLGAHVLAQSAFMNDVAAILVPEIDDGPNAGYGPATLTIGRLGRCDFHIRVPGTGGHGAGAASNTGVNAATETAALVMALEKIRQTHADDFDFLEGRQPDPSFASRVAGSFYVNRIDAGDGTLSIPVQGDLSLSYTFTPARSVAAGEAWLSAVVAGMYASGELKPVEIDHRIFRAEVALSPRPTPPCGAYLTPADHPFCEYVRGHIDATVGFRGYNMGFSVCDQNVFHHYRPDIPIVDVAPLGQNFHRSGEWVGVESVRQLQALYREVARGFGTYLSECGP